MKNRFAKAGNGEKTICAVISILVFLVIWQLVASFTEAGKIFAGPIEVLGSFFSAVVRPIGNNTIQEHVLWSLFRVLTGFVIGSALGVIIGILMGQFAAVNAFVRPIFEVIRPIPAIAWIPLSITWFGLGESAKYFLIALSSFCSVTINCCSGAASVDQTLIGAATMLGANKWQVFTTIVLPSCVPHIFAGLQIAIGSAWATVVAAEMVRSSEGVGWVIVKGQEMNSTVQILVGIVGVGIVGFLLAVAMRAAEANLCRWSVRGK